MLVITSHLTLKLRIYTYAVCGLLKISESSMERNEPINDFIQLKSKDNIFWIYVSLINVFLETYLPIKNLTVVTELENDARPAS